MSQRGGGHGEGRGWREGEEGGRWERLAWVWFAHLGRGGVGGPGEAARRGHFTCWRTKVFIAANEGHKRMKHKHSRNSKPQGENPGAATDVEGSLAPALRSACSLCASLRPWRLQDPGVARASWTRRWVLEGPRRAGGVSVSRGTAGPLCPGLSDFCLVRSSQLEEPLSTSAALGRIAAALGPAPWQHRLAFLPSSLPTLLLLLTSLQRCFLCL